MKIEKLQNEIWSYLMQNIDDRNWDALKQLHNKLDDARLKLCDMKQENESIKMLTIDAHNVLKKVRKNRRNKKFKLTKTDPRERK